MFNLLTFTLYLSHIYRDVINVQTLPNASDISSFTYPLEIPFKAISTRSPCFLLVFLLFLSKAHRIIHIDNKETISIFTRDYI